ncbi:hypothetical protein D3C87_687650 [compost metagenome]
MLTVKRVLVLVCMVVLTACGDTNETQAHRDFNAFVARCDPASIRHRASGNNRQLTFIMTCRDTQSVY